MVYNTITISSRSIRKKLFIALNLLIRKLELWQVNNAGINGAVMNWDAFKASEAATAAVVADDAGVSLPHFSFPFRVSDIENMMKYASLLIKNCGE